MLSIQINAKKLENKQNQWQKIRYDIFGNWSTHNNISLIFVHFESVLLILFYFDQ